MVSASKQLMREKEAEQEFVLENPQISVEKTLLFLKKLTVAVMSSIAYLRNIFPEEAFKDKRLLGVPIKIVQGIDNVPGTKTFINWFRSAFKVVSSHCLKKIMLVIEKEGTSKVLEVFTFTFTYNREEIQCELVNEQNGERVMVEKSQSLPEDIENSLRQLLRSVLTMTHTMHPLPDDWEMCMKLELDETAPDDFSCPQDFTLADSNQLDFLSSTYKTKLGTIRSKFTTFSITTKAVETPLPDNSEEKDSEEILPSQEMTENQNLSIMSRGKKIRASKVESSAPDANTTNLSEELSAMLRVEEKKVVCICGDDDDEFDNSIRCASCSTFQHRPCYKLLDNQQTSHICIDCHDPNTGKSCSAPELVKDTHKKEGAIFRRALFLCSTSSQVSCAKIMTHLKLSRHMASKILSQLENEGCLLPRQGRSLIFNVNTEPLQEILNRYCKPNVECNNEEFMDVDRNLSLNCGRGIIESNKRRLEEDKENSFQENPSPYPQQKRQKIFRTSGIKSICQ